MTRETFAESEENKQPPINSPRSINMNGQWSAPTTGPYKYDLGPCAVVNKGQIQVLQHFKRVGPVINHDVVFCNGTSIQEKHTRLLRNVVIEPKTRFSAIAYQNILYCFYLNNQRQIKGVQVYGKDDYERMPELGVVAADRPAIAVYKDSLFMVFQGAENGQIWYKVFDVNGWHDHILIKGPLMAYAPSLAVYNDKLYCVFHGYNDNSIWYMTYEAGGWSQHRRTSMTADGSPSLCIHNDRLYCAYVAQGTGELSVSFLFADEWVGHERLQGHRTTQGPDLASFNGALHCFYLKDELLNCTSNNHL